MPAQLRIGRRSLRVRPGLVLLTVTVAVGFGLLGRWQWHRAEEKRALAAAFAIGGTDFASELDRRSTAELPRYTQLRVRGHFEPDHQFLLEPLR